MRKRLVRAFGFAAAATLLAGGAPAQEKQKRMVVVQGEGGMRSTNVMAFAPQGGTYTFIGAHAGMEGKVIKGSPYSADGVTETERVLADGTKITKKTTSKIYRDSEGRTRREMTLDAVGPWSADGEAITTVTINDPVAGRMYVMKKGGSEARTLDVIGETPHVEMKEFTDKDGNEIKHEVKIIRRHVGEGELHEKHGEGEHEVDVDVHHGGEGNVWIQKEHTGHGEHVVRTHDLTAVGKSAMHMDDVDARKEDLGERNIEGVVAKGTRTTRTIPEGKIGNDRPIEITSERWYSEELGTVVMTKTTDPMSGNTTFRLTSISRAEPDPALFEMDEDVEIHEGHSIQRRIKIEQQSGPGGI